MFSIYSQLSDIPKEFRNACILVDVHRIFQDCLFVLKKSKDLAFIATIAFFYFFFSFYGKKDSCIFYHYEILITANKTSLLNKYIYIICYFVVSWFLLSLLCKGKNIGRLPLWYFVTVDRITDTISWHQHIRLQDL